MDMDAFWKEMESILQTQKEHFMQHITLRYVMSSIISFFILSIWITKWPEIVTLICNIKHTVFP